jgi:hypothetical protein
MATRRRAVRVELDDETRDDLRERFAEIIADIAELGAGPGTAVKLFGEALQDNLEDGAIAVTKTAAKQILDRLFPT